jgi:hypothetical protein
MDIFPFHMVCTVEVTLLSYNDIGPGLTLT